MTDARYKQLDEAFDDKTVKLTPEELREGWHFCMEFDGLLTQGEILRDDGSCICGFDKGKV